MDVDDDMPEQAPGATRYLSPFGERESPRMQGVVEGYLPLRNHKLLVTKGGSPDFPQYSLHCDTPAIDVRNLRGQAPEVLDLLGTINGLAYYQQRTSTLIWVSILRDNIPSWITWTELTNARSGGRCLGPDGANDAIRHWLVQRNQYMTTAGVADIAGPSPNNFDDLVLHKQQRREHNRAFVNGNRQPGLPGNRQPDLTGNRVVLDSEMLDSIMGNAGMRETFLGRLTRSGELENVVRNIVRGVEFDEIKIL